jgi:hypothetical protein
LGGFYSSLDADSEGVEGRFYGWDFEELRNASPPEDWELVRAAFGLDGLPNFEGRWILRQAQTDVELAEAFGLKHTEVQARLAAFLSHLHAIRSRRIRPATDDKVLLAWNGLALRALAEAAWYLRSEVYLQAAQRCAAFLTSQMVINGQAYRSWRQNRVVQPAFLEDYASLGLGLLALYQADHDAAWYSLAAGLAAEMLARFRGADSGFYDTQESQGGLLYRPSDVQDNATPCGSSLAAEFLLRLAALSGNGEYHDIASGMIRRVADAMGRYPLAFGNWLRSADLLVHPIQEVAIVLPSGPKEDSRLLDTIRHAWVPNLVLAVGQFPAASADPELLRDRPLLGGKPTAYVCRQMVCLSPVVDSNDLAALLESPNHASH